MSKKIWITIAIVICISVVAIVEIRTKKIYQTDASKIQEIIVKKTSDKVKVRVSKDDKLHVVYYKGISYNYDIEEKDGQLKIAGKYKFPISFDFQSPTLIIELPAYYGNKLEINTEGNCSVDQTIKFSDIKINSDEK